MNQVKVNYLNKICKYFNSLKIDLKEKNLCVCLSGGADSVSLLSAMFMLKDRLGINLSACHFNHMIRGAEADRDEEFCKKLCKKFGVKIYCGRDDVPEYARTHKCSVEEAARECRYAFFQRISVKYKIDFCLTAHNMNDDAETLLHNLIRGAGVNGATAISPFKGTILRPLLEFKRSEIEAFLTEINQEYVFDNTNDSTEYTRNYIRKVLMPAIEEINPSAVDALSRYIHSARVDRDFFEGVIDNFSSDDLRNAHEALRIRIIYKKFLDHIGYAPNSAMLAAFDAALFSEKRTIMSVSDEFEAVVGSGRIEFYRRNEIESIDFDEEELSEDWNILFGNRVNVLIDSNLEKNTENFNKIYTTNILSFDNIKGVLRVRNRRVGDKIKIHGVNKSVKKLLIEKRIPKEYRNILPVFLDDEGIIYIPFVGISDRAFPKDCICKKMITTLFNTVDTERWYDAYEEEK